MPSLLFAFVFAVHRAHAPEQGAHFILFVHVRSVGPCDKGHMAMVHNIILQYYDPLDTYSGLARVRTDKNRPFLCIKSGRFSTASMSVLYRITVGCYSKDVSKEKAARVEISLLFPIFV